MAGWSQTLRTALLLGLMTGLLLLIGGLAGGERGVTVALGFSLVMNLGSWWFSDRIVLAVSRARRVTREQEPRLVGMVEELSRKAGIPMPAVYITPDPSPNAFATGRGPSRAAVAATQGILDLLNDRELRGVLAHELGHVRNRDVLVSSIAASLAGAVMWLAYMMRWVGLFGAGGDRDREGNGLVLLLMSILAPIAAMIIQMAISRSREYKADVSGAELCEDPGALADALQKLAVGVRRTPCRNESMSTVHGVVNGFSGQSLSRLFSTHPPIEDRIARLREMVRSGRVRVVS